MASKLTKEERDSRDRAVFRDVQSGMTYAAAARKNGVHKSMARAACDRGGTLELFAIAVSKEMTDEAAGIPMEFPPAIYRWDIDSVKDEYGRTRRERLNQVYRWMEHKRRIDAGEYAVQSKPKTDDVMQTCGTW